MPTATDSPAVTQAVLAKERVWPSIGYEPHQGQRRLHASRARNRLASCGRRWGKSKAGGHELVPEALFAYTLRSELEAAGAQRRFWIVGPNYDDGEREWRVFYDSCKRLELPFDRPGTYNDTIGGNMQMSLWDGKFIVEVRSAAHPESLDGEGLDGVLMVEAAKMKELIWSKFIRAALADKRGWSWFTSTPEGKNWFYELWKMGQDPLVTDWQSWRLPSWDNTVVFPGGRLDPEILALARDMSDAKFNQEIGADFTDFVGRVFKDFEYETHVRDLTYDPRYPLYACCDYGWTNPFVWLLVQVDVWDNVYVLAEYRATQRDVTEVVTDLKTWNNGASTKVREFYPDPAEPGDTNIIANGLRIKANKNTGGELRHRLELIRNHLKPIPDHVPVEQRKPRLLIDRSCHELIREMQDYRYPERRTEDKAAPEQPMDKDDHGPEALGRFFRGHYGMPASEGRSRNRARQRRAKVAR